MNLTSLEKQVTEMLLGGDDTTMAVLRQQIKHARVSSRKETGVGFYTEFVIPSELPRLPGYPTFKLGNVNGTAVNVKHGLGFLLYVSDGTIAVLEGYTYDEPWPDKVQGLTLAYSEGQNRNMSNLRKAMEQ